MADPGAANDILNGQLGNILNFLSAAAGLGTAAMGLVDATKAFGGGPSNFGFGYIEREIGPFLVTGAAGGPALGKSEVLKTLKANWINGIAKADQKAKAKSLIHLRITQGNAAALAGLTGVDGTKLTSLAQKTATGVTPGADEINVLGQFDAILSSVLDRAYERGDQKYRNASKFLAMVAATILAAVGGWLVFGSGDVFAYMQSRNFALSVVIGLSATPLAPMAKDLASSLQAAVTAVKSVKR